MFHWDCTGKKVVPTITRGVELGEGGKSLTLHLRRGTKSTTGSMVLPGNINAGWENTDPNDVFEPLLSFLARAGKAAVKKTDDRPPPVIGAIIGHLIRSATADWPSISRPSGKRYHHLLRFLPYSER